MEKMTFPSENSGDYSGLMDFNGFFHTLGIVTPTDELHHFSEG